ncbi:MAG: anti-sigma factor [Candidatus Binatia bacterium]
MSSHTEQTTGGADRQEPPSRGVEIVRPALGFWASVAAVTVLLAVGAVAACAMYALGLFARARALEAELTVQRGLAAFLSSPETATIVLAGTEVAPKARLKLSYDRSSGRAVLFGYDLPPPEAGRAYQLWFIAGGTPRPGRVFAPDATGRGSWNENVPPEGRDASVFAVTLEPASGVAVPSGPMILKSVSFSYAPPSGAARPVVRFGRFGYETADGRSRSL